MYFNHLLDPLASNQVFLILSLGPPRWFTLIHRILTCTHVEDHKYRTSYEGAA